MRAVVYLAAVLLVGMFGRNAHADTYWSVVGSGCVVDSRYASNAVVDSQTGAVTFATNASGTIMLTCPIAKFSTNASCLSLEETAYDPSTNAYVYSYFNYSSRTTGTAYNITEINSGTGSGGTIYSVVTATMPDFTNYYYWVDVVLYRSSSSVTTPIFFGVGLTNNCT